jgi:primosomal protein N' (replication factor Y)
VLPAPNTAGSDAPAPLLRAQVVVAAPVGILDYQVPEALYDSLQPGSAVTVALGNRRMPGYVLTLAQGPHPRGIALKDLGAGDGQAPDLPADVLRLLLFAAPYYRVAPGEMLAAALPKIARPSAQRYVLTALGVSTAQVQAAPGRVSAASTAPVALQALLPLEAAAAFPAKLKLCVTGARGPNEPVLPPPPPRRAPSPTQRAALSWASQQPGAFGVTAMQQGLSLSRPATLQRLRALKAANLIEVQVGATAKRRQVAVFSRVAHPDAAALQKLQDRLAAAAALYDKLPAAGAGLSLAALEKISPKARSRMQTLVKMGLAQRQLQTVEHVPFPIDPSAADGGPDDAKGFTPTEAQAAALACLCTAIAARTYSAHLLHGVTGSGKTEVYLRAIETVLAQGRTALVLVPEIALTPQLGERFRSRFGNRVATFHSGLTEAERRDEWERVHRGEALIGLGARSALFLPLKNLGIIIVDEEHETSFKQDEAPRYHARDLAVFRAHDTGAVIVLGSATPSLETYQHAKVGRYNLLNMPARVADRPLPVVELIPLSTTPKEGDGVFTKPLLEAMQQTLTQGEQVILFLNRRGFAPYVFCHDCGHSYRCDACDVALTLHRRRGVLCCHYCGFEMAAPQQCAACNGHKVKAQGLGTEKVQAEVQALFPGVETLRLDRDVVRKKAELDGLLGRFRRREAQILIGTQMVAKGHDFPGVTLVGVIAADASLNFPDFRAAERTFSLLTQVAGRAGRGSRIGRVLVQAYETEHYAIAAAAHHDYAAFVQQELQTRQELLYPPFAHLALLRFEGPKEHATQAAAETCANQTREHIAKAGLEVSVLGPAPAPLAKLRDQYRFTVLLKAAERKSLRQVLQHLPPRCGQGVQQIVDVDPVHML